MRTIGRVFATVALALGVLTAVGAPAGAQFYAGTTPPGAGPVDVLGARGVQAVPSVQVLGQAAQRVQVAQAAPVSRIAVTGGDILGLLTFAMVAVGGGAVMVRVARRRPAQ